MTEPRRFMHDFPDDYLIEEVLRLADDYRARVEGLLDMNVQFDGEEPVTLRELLSCDEERRLTHRGRVLRDIANELVFRVIARNAV